MRALVTGGAGFIGSTLVDALLALGHEVSVVDDLSRGRREQIPASAHAFQLDITDPALTALISETRPEVVFHQAAQIDVRRSVEDPQLDARINVLGTLNVLLACARSRVRRVVFASSGGAVYGDTAVLPTREEHPCSPASPYGAAKLAGETYGRVLSATHGIEFTALRYANVYGPRQDPRGEAGVVAIFAERLLAGEPCLIHGDGEQTRDYVHVDDVVRANLKAASSSHTGVFNIGTARETSVNAIYRALAAAAGGKPSAQHGPGKPGEQLRSCVDISRAARALDWRPQIQLDVGLRATLDWFRSRSPE
ncbi:MAG: NAD-dependent epimerase/dehydratase family protein [Candidatus Dormibacteria bacterium]